MSFPAFSHWRYSVLVLFVILGRCVCVSKIQDIYCNAPFKVEMIQDARTHTALQNIKQHKLYYSHSHSGN